MLAGVVQRLEFQPSKLAMWVRFPSPAPKKAMQGVRQRGNNKRAMIMHIGPHGSVVEHFLGKEEVTGSIPVVGSKTKNTSKELGQ